MTRILERGDRPLCSRRNPQKEALDWLRLQNILDCDKKALVLGYGAGYHVEALLKHFPKLEVDVVELDPAIHKNIIRGVRCLQIEDVSEIYDLYLPFRSSWVGFELKYQELLIQWTNRIVTKVEESSAEWSILKELVQ